MTERDDELSDTLEQQTNHSQKSSFAGVQKKTAIDPVALQSGLDALDLGVDAQLSESAGSLEMSDAVDLEPLDVLGESGIVGAVQPAEEAETPTAEFLPAAESEDPEQPAVPDSLLERIWRLLTGWMRV